MSPSTCDHHTMIVSRLLTWLHILAYRPPGGGGGDNPGNNLHVSSLAISIDERALETHFAKYGEVRSSRLMPGTRLMRA